MGTAAPTTARVTAAEVAPVDWARPVRGNLRTHIHTAAATARVAAKASRTDRLALASSDSVAR
ncbi:hypothetical protein ABZ580_06800 [Streptomyces sp. NPDC012486]|uniref:hypothetical protein n=1 Tax=Streptomyces TaxID=1883 RepID=UPI002E165612|nr:hypothetical protein OG483_09450 [[Kitasatospora] papulosa]